MLAAAATHAGASGKRANVGEVSKAVSGSEDATYSPGGLARPPKTEDGRDLVYMEVMFVTALRENRPARLYSLWPRLTMSPDASASNYYGSSAQVRDAMITVLGQLVQIDWPGESHLDVGLASQLAKDNVNRALGSVKLDAIDFVHIEVQIY